MSRGVNRVTLIGGVGQDPELRTLADGSAVTNLRIATGERWKDRNTEEVHDRTEWHSVAMFNRLAEIAVEYLRKGSQVYIEGKLRTRKWQDKDGQNRYTTEVVAEQMQMLGGGPRSSQGQQHGHDEPQPPTNENLQMLPEDKSIPF